MNCPHARQEQCREQECGGKKHSRPHRDQIEGSQNPPTCPTDKLGRATRVQPRAPWGRFMPYPLQEPLGSSEPLEQPDCWCLASWPALSPPRVSPRSICSWGSLRQALGLRRGCCALSFLVTPLEVACSVWSVCSLYAETQSRHFLPLFIFLF